MSTINELLYFGQKNLLEINLESAILEARLLLQHALQMDNTALLLNAEMQVPAPQTKNYEELIARRILREPVAKIIGKKAFWKHDFITTKNTLDPRPDTETLIESVLEQRPNRQKKINILELGVGTGCILLSLLDEYDNATGIGVDISAEALAIAQKNAENLHLNARIKFIQSNWTEKLTTENNTENNTENFDIIVSNPPYIPSGDILGLATEVAEYDPLLALAGGTDGLDAYRTLIPQAVKHLKQGGLLALEIGQGQEQSVAALGGESGLDLLEQRQDLSGIIRTLTFELK